MCEKCKIKCPECQELNAKNVKFCTQCGASLEKDENGKFIKRKKSLKIQAIEAVWILFAGITLLLSITAAKEAGIPPLAYILIYFAVYHFGKKVGYRILRSDHRVYLAVSGIHALLVALFPSFITLIVGIILLGSMRSYYHKTKQEITLLVINSCCIIASVIRLLFAVYS